MNTFLLKGIIQQTIDLSYLSYTIIDHVIYSILVYELKIERLSTAIIIIIIL